MVGSNSQTPMIILGERIAGTNEWKFEPQALNKDKAITVTYDKDYIDTLKIQILQHVELVEGWNWMSLYSDQLYEDQIKTYFPTRMKFALSMSFFTMIPTMASLALWDILTVAAHIKSM